MDNEAAFPERPEDAQQTFTDIPVYRGVGPIAVENFTSVFHDRVVLPSENDLMVDIPTYHKGKVGTVPRKVDALSVLPLPHLCGELVATYRSFSPIATQLPCYDADDIHPLESTHVRVSNAIADYSSGSKQIEKVLFGAIEAYLKANESAINISTADETLLLPPRHGFWKCSAGELANDFSHGEDYVSFGIQCYVDSADGNLIVEWQRRRGSAHYFKMLFQHFSDSLDSFLDAACEDEADESSASLCVTPVTYLGHLETAMLSVNKLSVNVSGPLVGSAAAVPVPLLKSELKEPSPNGPVDLLTRMFHE